MNCKETKLSPVLGANEHYNPCTICGADVQLQVDDYGEIYAQCTRCSASIGTNIVPISGQNLVDACRLRYNSRSIQERYSIAALAKMGLENGDYIVTEVSDEYIVFQGNAREIVHFLCCTEIGEDHSFHLYKLDNGYFSYVGLFCREIYPD